MAEIDEDEIVRDRDGERSLFSGVITLLYAFAMLSVWFVRSGEWGAGGPGAIAYDATELVDVGD
jgi:hypothetical protein